mmetsp:Transcript_24340/g.36104  ORF Transcript_24340/g.36104 Transcript_24340/m.36104 type:complete len:344 (-) Transcript_24340:37-1068(-)
MELHQTEDKVNDALALYRRLRTSSGIDVDLPEIPSASENGQPNQEERPMTIKELLTLLQTIRSSLEGELKTKIEKFRRRLAEKDPITGAPRYGTKTAERVRALSELYDQLVAAIELLGDTEENLNTKAKKIETEKQRSIKGKELIAREQAQKDQQRKEEEELKRKQEEAAHEEALQKERLELNRRAEESRRSRQQAEQLRIEEDRRARDERLRRDQEWMAGIPKGLDGVRMQLKKLREAAPDASSLLTALTSLHTLFSQIVSHPEEPKFRRVREDHPQFNADIGKHDGGKEILIAAGFRLGAIDDIPCFISTEPSLENDMDGWSHWFDLLKETQNLIEQELMK